jgi:hypothetical protein
MHIHRTYMYTNLQTATRTALELTGLAAAQTQERNTSLLSLIYFASVFQSLGAAQWSRQCLKSKLWPVQCPWPELTGLAAAPTQERTAH